jgi:uncharacterized protein
MTNLLDLGLPILSVCFVAIFAGGLVKGLVGIGLPLVALPIMVVFIPIPKAIALLLISSLATSVWQSFHGGHFMHSIKRFWPMLLGLTIGISISVKALTSFDIRLLYLILGVIVAVFSTILQRQLVFTITPRAERWVAPMVGLGSGLIGGISMLFGPMFAIYLSGLKLGKNLFIAVISLAGWWAMLVLAAAMTQYQLLDSTDLLGSVLALIPSFLGLALGQHLRSHINENLFRKCLAVILFLIGLNLLRRALG